MLDSKSPYVPESTPEPSFIPGGDIGEYLNQNNEEETIMCYPNILKYTLIRSLSLFGYLGKLVPIVCDFFSRKRKFVLCGLNRASGWC